MPSPGELIGGRYRLDDRIAAGGMGEVWRATDTVLERPVAVKTLLAGYADDAGFRTRFHHEARAMAALRHAGVAPVYDFGDTGDGAYLVMARVDGVPLNKWLADRGPLSPDETMSIVAQAARALGAAHEAGIVHRDVKPGNLIIEPDGTVVLVDFGVARSAQSVDLTGAKEVVGTALYMAPEQVSKQTLGPAADLYALGVVAYQCLAGQPPFTGENPLAVALQHVSDPPPPLPASVPEVVRDLVLTALTKDPAQRFPSAFAMAEAAEAARGAGPATGTAAGLAATAVDIPAPRPTGGAGAPFIGSAFIGSATPPVPPPNPAFVTMSDIGATQGGGGLPAAATGDHSGRRRRPVVFLSVLTAILLGLGASFAFADPFGLFGDKTPVTPTPGASVPARSPTAPAQGGGQQEKPRTESTGKNEERPADDEEDDQPEPTRTATTSATTTRPTTAAPTGTTTTTDAPEEEDTAPAEPTGSAGAEANG